jgi:hypothetical protein
MSTRHPSSRCRRLRHRFRTLVVLRGASMAARRRRFNHKFFPIRAVCIFCATSCQSLKAGNAEGLAQLHPLACHVSARHNSMELRIGVLKRNQLMADFASRAIPRPMEPSRWRESLGKERLSTRRGSAISARSNSHAAWSGGYASELAHVARVLGTNENSQLQSPICGND